MEPQPCPQLQQRLITPRPHHQHAALRVAGLASWMPSVYGRSIESGTAKQARRDPGLHHQVDTVRALALINTPPTTCYQPAGLVLRRRAMLRGASAGAFEQQLEAVGSRGSRAPKQLVEPRVSPSSTRRAHQALARPRPSHQPELWRQVGVVVRDVPAGACEQPNTEASRSGAEPSHSLREPQP